MHGTFKTIETKADPFSLDTLIAWLEKQPADTTYCYSSNGECLMAQYLSGIFDCQVLVGSRDFCRLLKDGKTYGPNEYFPDIFHDIAQGRPRNFGSALSRARSALSS